MVCFALAIKEVVCTASKLQNILVSETSQATVTASHLLRQLPIDPPKFLFLVTSSDKVSIALPEAVITKYSLPLDASTPYTAINVLPRIPEKIFLCQLGCMPL